MICLAPREGFLYTPLLPPSNVQFTALAQIPIKLMQAVDDFKGKATNYCSVAIAY
jgi:hypothetical protein